MSDKYDGIFDHLTPADFEVQTSAIQIDELSELGFIGSGPEAFEQFFRRHLHTTRVSYKASEGAINPMAILANGTTQYTFAPDDDETLDDYVARLRREAVTLGATWTFIARMTMVGKALEDEDEGLDTSDPDAIQRALQSERLSHGVNFYAQRNEAGQREQRLGIMHSNRDSILGEVILAESSQTNEGLSILQ